MAQRAQVTEAGLREPAGMVPSASTARVGCGPDGVMVRLAGTVGDPVDTAVGARR